jgi:hypothetical protein
VRFAFSLSRLTPAAAGLHHGHIVPVFGVGDEGGVHDYALRYLEQKARPLLAFSGLEREKRLSSAG